MSIIKVDNVTFEYPKSENRGKVTALSGISLDIEEGSFVAVIGQNGSGKSTLAKNMNALFLPTEGAVFVDGFDTKSEEHVLEIRKTCGMVFQNPDNQLVSSIVEDDVAFGPENMGIPPEEIRRRVDESLASVNMGDYSGKAPHLLSGGQKQRVAIAGVIAMRPKCIVFDEPTAMLDPAGKKDIMNIVKELSAEGITCILITHFMDDAALADEVIVMNKGRIAMRGTPEDIYEKVDEIRELGLDVPMAVDIADRLRKRGIKVPKEIITRDALLEFITGYRRD